MAYTPEDWGEAESNLWDEVSEGFGGLGNDSYATALFDAGWVDSDISTDDRSAARDAFFEYAIDEGYYDSEADFDWEAWREANDY